MLFETRRTDPELASILDKEKVLQEECIEMIAAESTAPIPVIELTGSLFLNKSLEGYPGNRYHAGAEMVDVLERLAWERAKALFGAEYVNIQPYSGTMANYNVYAAVLNPGDKVIAMNLDHGGHLSHGGKANWVSKFYDFSFYGCDPETGFIDYEEMERMAHELKPKLIICGASSYPRLIDYERVSKIAKDVGAYSMCDMAHVAGLVAAKVIPNPIPHMDFVTSTTDKTFCSIIGGMSFCKEEYAKKLERGTFPGSMGGMHVHPMAAKCWSFKYAASDEFRDIMAHVLSNAKCMEKELLSRGFNLVTGGTDNHMLMVDLRNKGITGVALQDTLDSIGISTSKNLIPNDPERPSVTSGLRIGLTSVTQRGMREEEVKEITDIIDEVVKNIDNKDVLRKCHNRIEVLIKKYPLYDPELLAKSIHNPA